MASATRSPSAAASAVHPYRIHVSQKYLDLTKRKLELTRLPRDPQGSHDNWKVGVTKSDLEPLLDHWAESYDWRAQETYYNDNLPQFRVNLNGTRLHFVHRQSTSPTAIPLLFVHGWPESFISVSHMIDALCEPTSTPSQSDGHVQSFHVVAPSIPGFGFSDALQENGNNMQTTAAIMDSLMQILGYTHYIAHGSGWAFKVCRILALSHQDSCMAVHTVNPDVPAPSFSYGYPAEPVQLSVPSVSATPPSTPMSGVLDSGSRPQTTAYALADSPSGLLACVLEMLQPPYFGSQGSSPANSLGPTSTQHSPVLARSPLSSASVGTPRTIPSPRHAHTPQSVLGQEVVDPSCPWTPTAIIDWTMIHWLAGPEVALRWLSASSAMEPPLWSTYSNVRLGITHFSDQLADGGGTGRTPPQWLEAYHQVVMVQRREGKVRFAAWERPAEVVMDLREFAGILGMARPMPSQRSHSIGSMHYFPPPGAMVPSQQGGWQ